MRTPSLRSWLVGFLSTLSVVSLAACQELLVEPALEAPAALTLSVAPMETSQPATGEGMGAAFDEADRVRIQLLRNGDVVETVDRGFTPSGSETRIRLQVQVEEEAEVFQLEVALLFQDQEIFEAERSVQLRQGETTSAEVELEPILAGVEVEDGPVVLEAIGEETQLSGAVVFATGDPIPGLGLTWSTQDTDVISLGSDGRVTALAQGEAHVVAVYENFSGTVTVAVTQAVAAVTVEPGQVELPINGTVQLAATLQDSNGNHIADEERTVTWNSSEPQIASVDGDGRVTAHETGEVAVTATAEGVSGLATVTVVEEGPVHFPDSNLESAIRDEIGKPEGEIFPSDLAQITGLGAEGAGISDLTGLEFATSLEGLNLRDNSISDITPLQGLTGLTRLWLGRNSISDVTPLQGLAELTILSADRNSISDLTPLHGLTSLTTLGLGRNSISDITPLQGLTGLTILHLWQNSISDLTPLQGLTGLTSLWLNDNSISDITPLEGLTSLGSLRLGINPISDITPLEGLTSLTSLFLHENSISDITPLEGLTSLTQLFLHENSISDVTPLQGLTQLTYLRLRINQITDVQGLVDNEGLGSGDRIELEDNPLGQQALCEQIPALQSRGVDVAFSGWCES